MKQPSATALRQLQALVLDVDGVLTPGDLFYDNEGRRLLRFNSKDGFGLHILCHSGFCVGVLSGRDTQIAQLRLQELGVQLFVGKSRDKATALLSMCDQLAVKPQQTAFMGDDIPDLAAFRVAGLRIAVQDACSEVLQAADWITTAAGGRGAVREVCEQIAKARGIWRFSA